MRCLERLCYANLAALSMADTLCFLQKLKKELQWTNAAKLLIQPVSFQLSSKMQQKPWEAVKMVQYFYPSCALLYANWAQLFPSRGWHNIQWEYAAHQCAFSHNLRISKMGEYIQSQTNALAEIALHYLLISVGFGCRSHLTGAMGQGCGR